MEEQDDFTRGYLEANEAIENKLPGYQDYSQGESEWDKGWNARLEIEQSKNE